MSQTIGRFDYKIFGGPKTHTDPVVEICLKGWTEDKKGNVLISAHLMTLEEIDGYIDALILDLDAVRRRAKRAFVRRRSN